MRVGPLCTTQEEVDADLANERDPTSVARFEVDRVALAAFPLRLLDFRNLTVLRLSSCGLTHLPNRLPATATRLQTLNVSGNPLRDLPDLSALLMLQLLDTRDTLLSRAVNVVGWDETRELILLYRKEYHHGGVREAVRTFLCIRGHCPDTHFSRCVARDVALLIGKAVWATRNAPEWRALNKRAHDMEVFHCVLPVPFATAFGPSCFRCLCGFIFGDSSSPEIDLKELHVQRTKHFVERYHSDAAGLCTPASIHFPLNCAVQTVCSYGRNRGAKVRTPKMVEEVIACLIKKNCNIARPIPTYAGLRAMLFGGRHDRNANTLYPSLILEDVHACLDEYLLLRASPNLPPKFFYGAFSAKVAAELLLFHKDDKEA